MNDAMVAAWRALRARRPAPVVTPVHVIGGGPAPAHPLAQIAIIDAGADRAGADGRTDKADALRGYASELLTGWLEEQFADGPALVMGDDGQWHVDDDGEGL